MLEDLIKQQIVNIKKGQIDKCVVEYNNTQNKYIVPKSTIIVEVALTDGLIAKIDVTEYFKEVL